MNAPSTPPSQGPALTPEDRSRLDRVDQLSSLDAEAVPELVQMLTDSSWVVRRAVVAALACMGNPAVDALIELLRTRRDHEGRIAAAVDALVASNGDVEPRVAERLVRDADPAVVADGAQILGRRRSIGSVPVLAELIRHPDDNVAVAAIEALGRIGGRAAVESLVGAVESGHFFRTFPAIDVLGRSGDPRAVPPLARLLGDSRYAPEAARALGKTGDRAAAPLLVGLLSSGSESHVRLGAVALSELGEQYARRYGGTELLEEHFRAHPASPQTVAKVLRSLSGADLQEQVAICRLLAAMNEESAIPELTALLEAPEPLSSAAAAALKKLSRSSGQRLVDALRTADSAGKQAILTLISRGGASAEVAQCLLDPEPRTRALACEALARMGNPAVVDRLFPLLDDPDLGVAHAATAAIQSLGSRETERLATEAAHSSSARVRRAALRIIAYFGYESALPVLVGALEDPDPRAREAAVQGLPFLDAPGALEALLKAAKAPDDKLRGAAMRALGNSSGRDLRVTSSLLRGLQDPSPWVRYYATQSLGRLRFEAAADRLAGRLNDDAGQVRVAAVEALSALESAEAAGSLRTAALDDELDLRRAALVGLGLNPRRENLPILLEAARSADAATRLLAISSLAEFDAAEAIEALAAAARDADESVRSSAIGILGTRRGPGPVKVLVELLRSGGSAELAISALAIPVEGRIGHLLDALDEADEELAPLLLAALARMGTPESTAARIQALSLPNPAARKAAASSVAALGTPDAIAHLRRAATNDPDPEVRKVCALLLESQ